MRRTRRPRLNFPGRALRHSRERGNPSSECQRWIPAFAGMTRSALVPAQQFSYFQFRLLPSAIHSTAWAMRLSRVSGRFASITHSTYSRRQLGGKPSNVARRGRIGGQRGLELRRRLQLGLRRRFRPRRARSGVGQRHRRSDQLRRGFRPAAGPRPRSSRPNCPMASRSAPVSPSTSLARQKPKVACALNAAIPASICPL